MNVQSVTDEVRTPYATELREALPLLSGRVGAPDHLVGIELPQFASLEKRRLRTYLAMVVLDLIAIAGTLICPLLSGPETMIVWTTKGSLNAEQEAQAGRDYRQAA